MNVLSVLASHDASIAYFVNNKLEYFLKEERLSGLKRDAGIVKGLSELIKNNYEVDITIINSNVNSDTYVEETLAPLIQKMFDCEIVINDTVHHKCHAILAFEKSKFNQSLVFVIDRNGTQNEKISEVESIFKINRNYDVENIYKNFSVEKLYDLDIHEHLKNFQRHVLCHEHNLNLSLLSISLRLNLFLNLLLNYISYMLIK